MHPKASECRLTRPKRHEKYRKAGASPDRSPHQLSPVFVEVETKSWRRLRLRVVSAFEMSSSFLLVSPKRRRVVLMITADYFSDGLRTCDYEVYLLPTGLTGYPIRYHRYKSPLWSAQG